MTTCQARSDSAGQMRCAKCNVTWDRDDAMVCPGEVPLQYVGIDAGSKPGVVVATRAHDEDAARSNRFVSALAPDPFAAPRRK